ncbi:MAG: hypothetical protein M1812_006668 [Candelaria pacifica]|nr:MAG: hypothetical protein M1812_006668 [Candelaria pacifica]
MRRLSTASVRSYASSTPSRKRKYTPIPALGALPAEILDQIFSYLPQETLHTLLSTGSVLTEAAAIAMYDRPQFVSTYRFAQFVHTVIHARSYAQMVRRLDISMFGMEEDAERPLAGWREWKYRSEPLYSLHKEDTAALTSISPRQTPSMSPEPGAPFYATHPRPNPFLKQWSMCRDIPMGSIIHVLEACKRLKTIDLSYLSIAADYRINSSAYPATAFTSLIFVSDVPKSWTWAPTETTPLSGADIVDSIIQQPLLESIRIKKGLWLSTELITRIVNDCPRLQRLSLRQSGMRQGASWAIKGSKDEVAAILRAEASRPKATMIPMTAY